MKIGTNKQLSQKQRGQAPTVSSITLQKFALDIDK